VMLSGETAKGKYPVECIKLMHEIAREAEACLFHRELFENLRYFTKPPLNQMQSTAIAAVEAAFRSFASIIVVLTHSGVSAHLVSQYRPRAVIMAVTRNLKTARQMHLYRACFPVYVGAPTEKNPFHISASTAANLSAAHLTEKVASHTPAPLDFKQKHITSKEAMAMTEWLLDVDSRVTDAIRISKDKGFCAVGDAVIVVTGWRPGYGTTNTLRVIYAD